MKDETSTPKPDALPRPEEDEETAVQLGLVDPCAEDTNDVVLPYC